MPKAVIMAGGPGERFWPLTHQRFPKYRIRLDNNESLLQKTYKRLLRLYAKKDVYVVTTSEHVKLIKKELPSLKKEQLFIEPMRRNTAAAIYFSCRLLEKKFGEREIVSFFPADHLIRNEKEFQRTLRTALRTAQKDRLATIGINPTFPATGYGYIEIGKSVQGLPGASEVKRFTEKPPRATAARYLATGRYLWNGGIFTWKLSAFFKAVRKHAPGFEKTLDLNKLRPSYARLPRLSIDYAVLEKAGNLTVIKTKMDWCDMGSWDMFHEKGARDKRQNLVHGLCHHDQVKGSLIVNQAEAPLITMGITDLIVVQTPRGTLVCKKGLSEEAALLSRRLS